MNYDHDILHGILMIFLIRVLLAPLYALGFLAGILYKTWLAGLERGVDTNDAIYEPIFKKEHL